MNTEKRLICSYGLVYVLLAFMSIKLTVPALAILNTYFDTSTFMLKFVGAMYLIVMAVSQLFWGTMIRPYHRKRIFRLSISVALVGTVISFASINLWMFLAGRIIEAFGAGASSILCRAMYADRLEKREIATVVPIFGMIFNFGPFIAPLIGQYIILYVGWRGIYVFYFIILSIYWYLMNRYLPETKEGPEEKPNPMHVVQDYAFIGSSSAFWSHIIGYMFLTGLFFAYYMTVPFWYLKHFQFNVHYYVFLALFTAIPNSWAQFQARRYVNNHSPEQAMLYGFSISGVGILFALILALFFNPAPWNLIAPLMIVGVGAGFVQAATNVGLMHNFRNRAGTAAAMIPVSGYACGGLGFLVLSEIPLTTLYPFAGVLLAIGVVLGLNAWLIRRIH